MSNDSIATFFIHLETIGEGNYFESYDDSSNIEKADSNSSADFLLITLVFYMFTYQAHIYPDTYLILKFILNTDHKYQRN